MLVRDSSSVTSKTLDRWARRTSSEVLSLLCCRRLFQRWIKPRCQVGSCDYDDPGCRTFRWTLGKLSRRGGRTDGNTVGAEVQGRVAVEAIRGSGA